MIQSFPPPPPIVTEGLSRRFGDRTALHNVSLTVERGTTCGLIGLNGAGKSTLIRVAVGLLPPTGGRVRINGVDVWNARVSAVRSLGYVPDRPNAYPWMRVRQAIDFSAKAWASAWNHRLAADLLRQYGLDPRQRCGKLSKGQGAKLSLLLALAHDPATLILDEPTDGLDPIARDEFLQQVLESTLEGDRDVVRTVLISSHALGELQRLTDTVAVLHEGTMLVHSPTAELLAGTRRLRVVLDAADAAAPTAVAPAETTVCTERRGREWSITLRAGADEAASRLQGAPNVSSVTVEPLSLDDLFKDMIRGRRTPAALEAAPC